MKSVFCCSVLLILLTGHITAAENFYAYHTKIRHSATDYMGKYADLVVVVGEKKLEFTRKTAYLPLLRTKNGTFLVDDMYPDRDSDYEFYYTYVRLIEETPEKIKVHWRYMPDIAAFDHANREKEPLTAHGFLGVVHEFYTIFPDGRVERVIKDARNTSATDWKNPALAIKQTLFLKEDGIEHGAVNWGGRGDQDDEDVAVEGRPVIEHHQSAQPVRYWSFDDGLNGNSREIGESIEEIETEVEGLFVTYKKGVSGTALAFDGYYTGVRYHDNLQDIDKQMTLEAWVALDVFPYNEAPVIHQSQNFGTKGYYWGIDPYGYPFFRLNGRLLKSRDKIKLNTWQHIAVTIGKGSIALFLNGLKSASVDFSGPIDLAADLHATIGLNSEKARCTDYVRDFPQNLPFIFGIQGVIDELKIYSQALSGEAIAMLFSESVPADLSSPVASGQLPGQIGTAEQFGAHYKTLPFQELWDNMWRLSDYADVIVKFDDLPTSVIYWHGSNYAANWITDKNQWMSDQSSEIFTMHGCSEHMADKQLRHSYARIIENNPARVVVHWRYPCVDIGYVCTSKLHWSDEYHTIYPDGTGIRKVVWNKGYDTPGFQDIQFFTNPGETALDVVDLQAMTVANSDGDIEKLTWAKPNKVPEITIENATIEWLNSKSKYKIFVIFLGGHITPWGANEQSKYTDDPFAGPWNHWPMHFVPSDGRFAVAHDRVTHFALGANDYAPQFGSLVHYGFSDTSIEEVIPRARFWQNPPQVTNIEGGSSTAFNKDEKCYDFVLAGNTLSFSIAASERNPLFNPAFVIDNWPMQTKAKIKVNGQVLPENRKNRQGFNRDQEGVLGKIIWLNLQSNKPTQFEISVR